MSTQTLGEAVWKVLDRLQEQGCRPRRTGSGFSFCCPAHEDSKPSGSLSEGLEGKALVSCFAGCTAEQIVAALGLRMVDLFSENLPRHTEARSRIANTYDYEDPNGKLAYQVLRFEPKDFRQRRPDGAGGWIWDLKGVTRLPYRLPHLQKTPLDVPVWIAEGERDADTLARIGFVASTNSGGAGRFRSDLVRWFKGRDVVIVADQDAAGWKHAFQLAWLLEPAAASVRLVDILPTGKDVTQLAQQIQDHGGNDGDTRRLLLALADRSAMVLDDWSPVPRV